MYIFAEKAMRDREGNRKESSISNELCRIYNFFTPPRIQEKNKIKIISCRRLFCCCSSRFNNHRGRGVCAPKCKKCKMINDSFGC